MKVQNAEKCYPMQVVVLTIATPPYGISQYPVELIRPNLTKSQHGATSLKWTSSKVDPSLRRTKILVPEEFLRNSYNKTSPKRAVFPGPARLFLPQKGSGQRNILKIENWFFYCFYFSFSSKHQFTTHSCSLTTKLTFFDTQVTNFSWPLTWYLRGIINLQPALQLTYFPVTFTSICEPVIDKIFDMRNEICPTTSSSFTTTTVYSSCTFFFSVIHEYHLPRTGSQLCL